MATLALQMAATGNDWSLTRDTQLRTQLETALNHIHGTGVVSGGYVTRTAAFAVEVASGTVFFTEGVTLTLSAAAAYSSLVAGTNYLWGVITVTRANPTQPTASDTYALTLTHNTTGTAPSSRHFLLAEINCRTAGMESQSDIENNPTGKYLKLPSRVTVAEETVAIPAADIWFIVTADFSDTGEFVNRAAFQADPGLDNDDILASEAISHKRAGVAAWRVKVPAGVSGSVTFTPVLYGDGWTGSDSSDISGTWLVEAEDEAIAALVDSFDDLEQRFRALLLWLVDLLGETPPARLVPDFELAAHEAS